MAEQTETPVIPPPSYPASSSKLPWIIGAVILLIVGVVGGWYLGRQSQQSNTSSTISPTQPNTTQNTEWKTYQNDYYEFEYPSTWSIFGEAPNITIFDKTITQPSGPDHVISIYKSDTVGRITFEDPVGKRVESGDKIFLTKLSDTTIDSKQAMKLQREVLPGSATDAVPATITEVKVGDAYYTITLVTISQLTSAEELEDAYEKVLSTLTFTNKIGEVSPTSLPGTSCSQGLSLHKNDFFAICYPTGAQIKTNEYTDTSNKPAINVVFTTSEDSLSVMSSFVGGWGHSPCISSEPVTVDGHPATRSTWKKELANGCDSTFRSFVTIIEKGNEESPYYVGLNKTDDKATFTDRTLFETIEKTLRIYK